MNPNMETEGNPGVVEQPVNEEKSDFKPELRYKRVKNKNSPLQPGVKFKFEGVHFEVVDQRKRGRGFFKILGIPVYVDENGREVAND